jgi:nitrogen fixation/metabolism regulation signal transduction histidine kinase
MSENAYRRKKYLVDKQFQFRLVGTFMVLVFISLFIFSAGTALYYWIRYMVGDNIFNEFIIVHKQVDVLDESGNVVKDTEGNTVTRSEAQPPLNRLELILPPMLLNILVILIVIAFIGIIYTHRIAGPVYRIGQDIKRVLEGAPGVKIRLRRGDKLKDLAQQVNLLIEKLEKTS